MYNVEILEDFAPLPERLGLKVKASAGAITSLFQKPKREYYFKIKPFVFTL